MNLLSTTSYISHWNQLRKRPRAVRTATADSLLSISQSNPRYRKHKFQYFSPKKWITSVLTNDTYEVQNWLCSTSHLLAGYEESEHNQPRDHWKTNQQNNTFHRIIFTSSSTHIRIIPGVWLFEYNKNIISHHQPEKKFTLANTITVYSYRATNQIRRAPIFTKICYYPQIHSYIPEFWKRRQQP